MRTEVSGNQSEVVALIPALRGFARTFYRNRDDADDLVQETLMKAIGAIDTFKEGTQLKSWLFTIMRNTFYTKVRKQRREPVGEEDIASWPISQPTQEWSQRGIELQAALERLPESQREVIVLIGVLGVSYEEAAGICNCEMGTIKSRLNRARTRLAFEMGETSREAVNQYDRAGIPAYGHHRTDRSAYRPTSVPAAAQLMSRTLQMAAQRRRMRSYI